MRQPIGSEREQPRGRDYMGGDLKGVDQQLDYLKALGVNVIYFNPIFEAPSNHKYNTTDYMKIDPAFGTNAEFKSLLGEMKRAGIRVIIDGVFNHTGTRFFAFQDLARTSARSTVSSLRRGGVAPPPRWAAHCSRSGILTRH